MPPRPVIAVIGAGLSGSLLALHLLQTTPPEIQILLIERRPAFGPGLAYGTGSPHHLLNVRVGNMSAWPDRPRHLEQWLNARPSGGGGPGDFITRGTYGRYLSSMIQAAIAQPQAASRLILVHDEAVQLRRYSDGFRLTLGIGRTVDARAVVLAIGNAPPGDPPGVGLENLPTRAYVANPWAADALDGLSETSRLLLLGTGLTMIDVAVSIAARGPGASILAISRRGLTPRRHEGFQPIGSDPPPLPAGVLSDRVRWVRERARMVGWRQAIDELRPITKPVWLEASPKERRRFLRHLRPFWDVHRHRMAPAVADRIEAMRAEGRLTTAAGRILAVKEEGDDVVVHWRPRNQVSDLFARVDRIINCTGLGGDLPRSRDSLLRGLFEAGAATPDDLGLGLKVDAQCRLIDAGGRFQPGLYAVGPITRGAFWEVVAAPDIRNQVAEAASHLSRHLDIVTAG